MINKLNVFQLFPESTSLETRFNRGSRLLFAASLLLIISFPFMGCETGGSVGSEIIPTEDGLESEIVSFSQIHVLNENTFSGRLTNTSLGFVNDPLYGTIRSVALIKPVIIRGDLDAIGPDDKMQLELIFREEIFGNRSAISEFEIYEAGSQWRGNQLRYNREVPVDFNSKVGEFQILNEQTITVDLSEEWKQKFAEFYNSESVQRDSLYRNNFTGLAIVPSQNNQSLRFMRTGTDPDQPELAVSRFLVTSPVEADDDEDEDEEDDEEEGEDENDEEESELEEGVTALGLRDWGASFIRTDIPEQESGFTLHNTETILELIPVIPVDRFTSRNIANATLVLTKDRNFDQLQPDFERISPDLVQLHVFGERPSDIMAEVFAKDPDFFRINEDESDVFLVNITQFVMDQVYGESSDDKLYLSTQITNGLLYSSQFYDLDAPEHLRPRIVITFIK